MRALLPRMTRQRRAALLLIAFGVMAVVSSYTRLSETDDELFHVRCGMEWWQKGTYTTQALHPPLARVADAMFLYLAESVRGKPLHEGISPRDHYMYRLVLTRLGTLPFYIFSCCIVLWWARRLFGPGPALWALGVYVTLSSVTAHAMLATTDMTYTAMLIATLYAFTLWLEKPEGRQSFWLGAGGAATLGSKYSALMHLPIGGVVILLAMLWDNRRAGRGMLPLGKVYLRHAGMVVLPVFVFVLWLIFRFDFGPLVQGIKDAERLSSNGFGVWFYEPLKNKGVWMFFPVVFFYKTPLTLLLASAAGNVKAWMDRNRAGLAGLVPLLLAGTYLLMSMTSNINLGVRHVLPLYPLLAIGAGYGFWLLWQWAPWGRVAAAVMLLCHGVAFCTGHPEHLAYFNFLAGEHPERITLDSDFDWGQSMIMLDEELQRRDIKALHLCARRDALWSAQFVVAAKKLPCPSGRVMGWVAVSRAHALLHPNIFTWLRGYQGVEPIGKTLDLYYFAPPQK